MFATQRIVSFIIVAAGISMLTGSAIAMTREQAQAQCRKELGVTGNAGGGQKSDGTTGRTNRVFSQVQGCVQEKMDSQGKK